MNPDVVIVGGGTVGGWCAYFLAREGLSVTLLEANTLGSGASSRAAGMVRAQGGTESAVRLGLYSQEFYRSQHGSMPLDSGFVAQGYCMPAFSPDEEARGKHRVAMQQSLGVDVRWIGPDEFDAMNPAVAPGRTVGASYSPTDGYLDPPRNVLAYTAACLDAGVDIRERTALTDITVSAGRAVGVTTSRGAIPTDRVVLAGGAGLRRIGRAVGADLHADGARHQVVVTDPHPDLAPDRLPMVFDIGSGIYWRPEEGGMLWGMSNPDEAPGPATTFDLAYLERMRRRVGDLVPVTASLGLRRSWAATIDFTPDYQPILGPLVTRAGRIDGAFVASAAGHGMMWGPGVSRAAADLVVRGSTDVIDIDHLGMDHFDADGRSPLAEDPIALPFPHHTSA